MKAIVLAGGLATRLRPLSRIVPKPLLPVLNEPILLRVLRGLREAGFVEIGVTIAPHCALIERHLGSGGELGIELTWLRESEPAGTGASLKLHRDFFGGSPALVLTADMLTGVDLRGMADAYERSPATVTVAVAEQDPATWPGDVVVSDGDEGHAYLFRPGAAVSLRRTSTRSKG
ncbi:MAG TPA: nucleotidyltransferase family protein [Solirubrobacterales bacterium]